MRRHIAVRISLALLVVTLLACGGANQVAPGGHPPQPIQGAEQAAQSVPDQSTGRQTTLPAPVTLTPPPIPATATATRVVPVEPTQPPVEPEATAPPQPTPTPKPASFAVNTPEPTPPAIVENLPTDYDAAEAVRQYAGSVLGINVDVLAAGSREGDLTLPPAAQASVDAAVSLAGVTYAALLSDGAASVSLGDGGISGDLTADIQDASLGAFSLLRDGHPPANPDDALNVVRATFPGVANYSFTQQEAPSGGGGPLSGAAAGQSYLFSAHTEQSEVDIKSGQAKVVAVGALVGVIPAGVNRMNVFVVLGKGALSGSIQQ